MLTLAANIQATIPSRIAAFHVLIRVFETHQLNQWFYVHWLVLIVQFLLMVRVDYYKFDQYIFVLV